jgi:hypothetical protein
MTTATRRRNHAVDAKTSLRRKGMDTARRKEHGKPERKPAHCGCKSRKGGYRMKPMLCVEVEEDWERGIMSINVVPRADYEDKRGRTIVEMEPHQYKLLEGAIKMHEMVQSYLHHLYNKAELELEELFEQRMAIAYRLSSLQESNDE